MKINLEVGKFYLTRDCRVAEVTGPSERDDRYPFLVTIGDDASFTYTCKGKYCLSEPGSLDLIRECTPEGKKIKQKGLSDEELVDLWISLERDIAESLKIIIKADRQRRKGK
jgi:hypothetical protein